jgi:hypothetical protein
MLRIIEIINFPIRSSSFYKQKKRMKTSSTLVLPLALLAVVVLAVLVDGATEEEKPEGKGFLKN